MSSVPLLEVKDGELPRGRVELSDEGALGEERDHGGGDAPPPRPPERDGRRLPDRPSMPLWVKLAFLGLALVLLASVIGFLKVRKEIDDGRS